jgi:hypothetical protein
VRTKTIVGTALGAIAVVVGASYAGSPGQANLFIWAAVCLLVLVFAAGWPRLLGLPAPGALSGVIGAAGLAAASLAAFWPMPQPMFWFPACAALGLVLVFFTQLLRGTGERLRLESTLAGAAGVLVSVLASGWVAADRLAPNAANSSMMLVSGASLAASILVCAIRWPDRIVFPLGLLMAALVAGMAGIAAADVAVLPAVVAGAVSGAVVVGFRALLVAGGGPRDTWGALAVGAAPVAAVGTMLYYVGRLLLR